MTQGGFIYFRSILDHLAGGQPLRAHYLVAVSLVQTVTRLTSSIGQAAAKWFAANLSFSSLKRCMRSAFIIDTSARLREQCSQAVSGQ